MYFFVFEMRRLKDILESHSLSDSLQRSKATQRIKVIVYVLYLVISVPSIILFLVLKNYYPDVLEEHRTSFDVFLLVRAGVRLIIEWFMLWQFAVLFRFFLNIKKEKLGGKNLSTMNKAVIWTVITLWVLGVIDSVNTTFVFALDQSSFIKSGHEVLRVLWEQLQWCIQFLYYLALLYLFDYQSKRVQA